MFPIPASVAEEVAGDGAVAAFEKGMAAFRTGDYGRARTWFQRAANAGLDTPQLSYNLGVTAFRLERFDEATATFQSLTDNPDWAAVAFYNLGLIAEQRRHTDRAAGFFRRALLEEGSEELRHLATLGLERTGAGVGATAADRDRRGQGLFSLAGGHDDNPGLLADGETVAGENGSAFLDLFAMARYPVGRRGHLGLVAYTHQSRESRFDQTGLRIAPGRSWRGADWRGEYEATYGHDRLDGAAYRETLGLRWQARRGVGANELQFRTRLRHVDAASAYAHLDGWQLRLGAALERNLLGGRVRFGYRLEENRRRDWSDGVDFVDHSPQRHGVWVRGWWSLAEAWRLQGELGYRYSRHASREVVDGETRDRRVDDLLEGQLRVERSLPHREWEAFAVLDAIHQRSQPEVYGYERTQVMVGVERSW